MNRAEHLEWCKQRALEYVNKGDLKEAFASFQGDMEKHPETRGHKALQMGTMLLLGGQLLSVRQMKNWITGFN
ncbi:MAG: hypothetical protein IPJ01_11120 [Micavibrio sp.]|nr:hypothetical protein [Micavibrio sp.]